MWRIDRTAPSPTPPAAGSTSPGSSANGRTSCGSSAPATLAPSARTTSSGCCRGTGGRPRWGRDRPLRADRQVLAHLPLVDEPGYRRQIKAQANLQEAPVS
jgi:hypothetical protein